MSFRELCDSKLFGEHMILQQFHLLKKNDKIKLNLVKSKLFW